MPISNISSGVSLTPVRELPGQTASAKKRVAVDQFITSLPGDSRQAPQDLHRAAVDIAKVSQSFNKKLDFVVDFQSKEVIVKVIDKTTDKVIKVLPPEELQRLHRKLKETIGFLFNEQV